MQGCQKKKGASRPGSPNRYMTRPGPKTFHPKLNQAFYLSSLISTAACDAGVADINLYFVGYFVDRRSRCPHLRALVRPPTLVAPPFGTGKKKQAHTNTKHKRKKTRNRQKNANSKKQSYYFGVQTKTNQDQRCQRVLEGRGGVLVICHAICVTGPWCQIRVDNMCRVSAETGCKQSNKKAHTSERTSSVAPMV